MGPEQRYTAKILSEVAEMEQRSRQIKQQLPELIFETGGLMTLPNYQKIWGSFTGLGNYRYLTFRIPRNSACSLSAKEC